MSIESFEEDNTSSFGQQSSHKIIETATRERSPTTITTTTTHTKFTWRNVKKKKRNVEK